MDQTTFTPCPICNSKNPHCFLCGGKWIDEEIATAYKQSYAYACLQVRIAMDELVQAVASIMEDINSKLKEVFQPIMDILQSIQDTPEEDPFKEGIKKEKEALSRNLFRSQQKGNIPNVNFKRFRK